jgi:hypothetical protein
MTLPEQELFNKRDGGRRREEEDGGGCARRRRKQNMQNIEQSKVGQKWKGGATLESGNGNAPDRII